MKLLKYLLLLISFGCQAQFIDFIKPPTTYPYNPEVRFNQINFQSNAVENFNLTSTSVNIWQDNLGNISRQTTGANKPTLGSGIVTLDGTDFVTLDTEQTLTDFSLYVVMKITNKGTQPTYKGFLGSSSRTDNIILYITSGGSPAIQWTCNSSSATYGGGGESNVHVFSIRHAVGSDAILGYNDRLRIPVVFNPTDFKIGFIGKPFSVGNPMAGQIMCVAAANSVLADTTHTRVVGALASRYGAFSGSGNMLFFGESQTANNQDGWTKQVADNFGYDYSNLGIGGTKFQTFDANSGYTRYPTQLISRPYNDWIICMYGTNDLGLSVSTYQTQYTAFVADLIAKGYDPRKIVLVVSPWKSGSTTVLDQYVTLLSGLAATYGTRYYNFYQAMVDTGTPSALIQGDGVHINSAGATLLVSGLITAMSGLRSSSLIINESGYSYSRSTKMRGPVRTMTNREKMRDQNVYQDF